MIPAPEYPAPKSSEVGLLSTIFNDLGQSGILIGFLLPRVPFLLVELSPGHSLGGQVVNTCLTKSVQLSCLPRIEYVGSRISVTSISVWQHVHLSEQIRAFESHWRRDFSGSSQIGTPVATLPGAWRQRVSAGTGRTGVSIL